MSQVPDPNAATPSRRWRYLRACAAGLAAFVGSSVAGLGITALAVRVTSSGGPYGSDAAAFGDAMLGVVHFTFGAVVTFGVAVAVGLTVTNRVLEKSRLG